MQKKYIQHVFITGDMLQFWLSWLIAQYINTMIKFCALSTVLIFI
jgi:hypothetical protein